MPASIVRWGWRLVGTLVRWTRTTNPAQDAMEAVCSIAHSAGVIRAALKLRRHGAAALVDAAPLRA